MKLLIKQAKVIDSHSPFNGQTLDILIDNGTILKLNRKISTSADQIINESGLCISPGWVDVFANFCDHGYEQK